MLVTASAALVDFVDWSGGTVWVRCRRRRGCRDVAFLEATVRPPPSSAPFDLYVVDRILVAARLPVRHLPEELHLSLMGRRRPRPVASWDGCAFVV